VAAAATPGRLRLASLAIVAGLIVALVVSMASLNSRHRATRDAGLTVEPLLVGTQDIYGSLADADATAADAFLTGGIEPTALLDQYSADIKRATDQLADVTRRASSAAARADLRIVTEQLPVYTGLVEAARANNRQNFPVGAAFLRQGSTLMRTQILPATNRVYQLEGSELHRRYSSAGAGIDTVAVVLLALIVLALLVGTQIWMASRTNRVFNLPLVIATVLILAASIWTLVAFAGSHHSMAQARKAGSDPVEILARTRSVALQASNDESLAIIARGSGQSYLTDFDNAVKQLGSADDSSSLLGQTAKVTADQPEVRQTILAEYGAYLKSHDQVRNADKAGQSAQAVATVATNDEYPHLQKLNGALVSTLGVSQARFASHASSARSTLSPLTYALPILIILAALLALAGIQQRINDYR
jgi:hypothetical protein